MTLRSHQWNGLRTTAKNLRKPKREVEDLRTNTLNTAKQNEITATEGIKQGNVCVYMNLLKNISGNLRQREYASTKNVLLRYCIYTAEGTRQPACSDNEDTKMWTANTELGNDTQSN